MKWSPPWIETNCRHHGLAKGASRAFTMVELLVSMAVLILLIAIMAGMINGATITIASNRNRLEADAIARMVFDRMGDDFESMIKRKDVDCFCKGMTADEVMTGNDRIFFYSEAPAYFSGTSNNSLQALVGYLVASDPITNAPALERLSKGLLRDSEGNNPGSMVFFSYASASGSVPITQTTLQGNWTDVITNTTSDTACHMLATNVFRMEICYLLKPYTKPDGTKVVSKYSIIPYNGIDASHSAVNGFQDVSAIVVAIAVLDDSSRKKLAEPGTALAAMAAKLADAAESDFSGTQPTSMAAKWNAAVVSGDFAPAGVPKTVASQVRIYERHFYLNNFVCN